MQEIGGKRGRGRLLEGDEFLGAYGMVADTRPSCHLNHLTKQKPE